MRLALVTTRVFILLLLAVTSPAFAQTAKISINDVTIVEGTNHPLFTGQKFAIFTVSLSASLSTSVSASIVVHDQTAKKGLDYEFSSPQSVFFSARQQSTTLSILIDGDDLPEGDETFTVELLPQFPLLAGKTIGTCTILDNDDAVSPSFQRVGVGEKGIVNIRLTDPAAANEQVLFLASDPALFTVPGFVTIPAGASQASIEFLGLKVGAGSILATLPPSRGGRTYELFVTVHDATELTLDPIQLNLSLGATTNVTANVVPPPTGPMRLLLQTAKSGIVSIPDTILTDAGGHAVIPVRTTGLGSTIATVSMLDINGGASSTFGVNVTLGPGPVVTSIVPGLGRASGGEPVRINGFNFSDHCAVSFGGIPAPTGSTLTGGTAITLLTPPHDAGTVEVEIVCGASSYVAANAFVYQPAAMKVTFPLFPNSGNTRGGTIVGVTGTDFRFDSCSVRFGEKQAVPVNSVGTTFISVASPSHAAGSVDVSVICGKDSVTVPSAFTYVETDDAPATVTFIDGLKQGAISLMSGTVFRGDDVVLVNGVVMPDLKTLAFGQHLFTLPEVAGQAAITLRDYAGRTVVRTVTIAPPETPVVTKLPDRITLGAEFSVTGTGLRSGLTYMLGPAPLQLIPNPVIDSNRRICGNCTPIAVFRAPFSVAPGSVSFTIADHGNVLVTKSVDVTTSGIAISGISPACGAFDGGSLITISGSGFDDGAAVQFGTTPAAEVVVKDRFTILARLPPAYGIAQPQITVFNPNGTAATLTNAFNYTWPGDPSCGGGRRRAAGH
jgi:hypothetical protein